MLFNDVVLFTPDFVLDCDKLSTSTEIYERMRNHGIESAFVYTISYADPEAPVRLVKIGMSSPTLTKKRKSQKGERLIRQVCNIPGWNEEARKSGNGSDFRENAIAEKIFGRDTANKDFLKIGVWDISKRLRKTFMPLTTPTQAAAIAEKDLIAQYKEMSGGKLPPLNYKDPTTSKSLKLHYIPEEIQRMFEIN